MGEVHAPAYVESVTVDAVVIRANGTVEDLGTIAEYHRDQSILAKAKRKLRQVNRRSDLMADTGPDPGTILGQYRIEVADENGTAHWGRVYSTPNEAEGDLEAAENANPGARVKVVRLSESTTGKTAKWEGVK